MAGDYTRFTFEPTKGFSGLHKQQGRVSLDSEFNEFEEILDRRTRSEMYDTVGQTVYPSTTPTAFQVGVTAGQLTIGIGRMYVDGIQAECFGDMSLATPFDPNVGGVVGSGPLLYNQQPFFYLSPPSALPFPALSPTAGDINLVYLDVWQREVTMFEDDDLREVALNGPDTATRVQTAWQVKVLFPADANSCTTPPATWATLTAPSTARLTTVLAPAVPSGGPCVINPAGGYTGIENRLYRVEIHRAGTLGGVGPARAQFKWSRDNASLAARVLSIVAGPVAGQSIVTVASTGRDSWTRFEPGNEIELLDDHVEYAMRETGRGGDMASVLAVNHATGEITIDTDLSAFAISAGRHPRIRRWDSSLAAPLHLRDVDSVTAFLLEDGISVRFGSLNTDTLRAGDHWLFAARTATGTIDMLTDAPPRGILHHYARLALVTSGATPGVTSDCREPWPPDTGCCTAVVHPGDSIQAAINSLPPAGGCVCLKAGVHNIAATILVHRSDIHIHGESEGAEILVAAGIGPAIAITPPGAGRLHNVMVEHLRIVQPDSGFVFIYAEDVDHLVIRDVDMQLTYTGLFPAFNIGIYVEDASDVLLEQNTVTNCMWGIFLGDIAARCEASGNTLLGPVYSLAAFSTPLGEFGIQFASQAAGIHRLERNAVVNYQTGIAVLENAVAATIAHNRIRRPVTNMVSSDPLPVTPAQLRAYLDSMSRVYAIDLRGGGRNSRVHDNHIELESDYFGGIRVQIDQVLVRGNLITSTLPAQLETMPPAIYCGALSTGVNATGATVIENTIQGPTTGIIVSLSAGVAVTDNRIDGQGRGWFGVRLDDCAYATVTGTLIAAVPLPFVCSEGDHNVLRNNRAAFALVGCGVLSEAEFTFEDNEITGATFGGLLGLFEFGNVSLSRNRIVNCGQLPLGPVQGGIIAVSAWPVFYNVNTLRIESCEVIDSGVGPDGKVGAGTVTGIQAWFPNCHIIGNRVIAINANVDQALEHRALRLIAPVNFGTDLLFAGGASALVSGNKFCGYGMTHLVELFRSGAPGSTGLWFDKIVFSSNVCDHLAGRGDNHSTVLLGGRAAAIAANTVVGTPNLRSISGDNFAEGTATANATTGVIDELTFTSVRPTPESDFNIRI
jgi:parallel beta-helix repeat protein